jgi:hypothetical protein
MKLSVTELIALLEHYERRAGSVEYLRGHRDGLNEATDHELFKAAVRTLDDGDDE